MAVARGLSNGWAIALTTVALCAALFALAPVASAVTRLSAADARGLAKKTAEQVREDLRSEGARKAAVAGCWRNSNLRVSCFLKVSGYDAELDFRWTCMLRMSVELRPSQRGSARYKARYGTPRCG